MDDDERKYVRVKFQDGIRPKDLGYAAAVHSDAIPVSRLQRGVSGGKVHIDIEGTDLDSRMGALQRIAKDLHTQATLVHSGNDKAGDNVYEKFMTVRFETSDMVGLAEKLKGEGLITKAMQDFVIEREKDEGSLALAIKNLGHKMHTSPKEVIGQGMYVQEKIPSLYDVSAFGSYVANHADGIAAILKREEPDSHGVAEKLSTMLRHQRHRTYNNIPTDDNEAPARQKEIEGLVLVEGSFAQKTSLPEEKTAGMVLGKAG